MQDTYQPTPEQEKLIARFMVDGSLHTWALVDQLKYIRYINERAGLPFGTIGMIDTAPGTDKWKRFPYATRQAAAEISKRLGLSLQQVARNEKPERIEFTYRATNPDGRFVEAVGACALVGGKYPMSEDQKANKVMHAQTKASRRAILDFSGLGVLDDSELESMGETSKVDLGALDTTGDTSPKNGAKTAAPSPSVNGSSDAQTAPSSAPAPSATNAVATPVSAPVGEAPKGNGTPPAASTAVAPPVAALAFEPPARYAENAALFQGDAAAIVADKEHMNLVVHYATKEAGWTAAQMSQWLLDTYGVRNNNAKETFTLDVFRKAMAGIDSALKAAGR